MADSSSQAQQILDQLSGSDRETLDALVSRMGITSLQYIEKQLADRERDRERCEQDGMDLNMYRMVQLQKGVVEMQKNFATVLGKLAK